MIFSSDRANPRIDNTNKSQKDEIQGTRHEALVNPDYESRGGKSLRTTQIRGNGARKGSRELLKRDNNTKLRQRGVQIQNNSPAGAHDRSCGFSSLISLNNNSYYNQSSDPPTATYFQSRQQAFQEQPALRSSLADEVLRPANFTSPSLPDCQNPKVIPQGSPSSSSSSSHQKEEAFSGSTSKRNERPEDQGQEDRRKVDAAAEELSDAAEEGAEASANSVVDSNNFGLVIESGPSKSDHSSAFQMSKAARRGFYQFSLGRASLRGMRGAGLRGQSSQEDDDAHQPPVFN